MLSHTSVKLQLKSGASVRAGESCCVAERPIKSVAIYVPLSEVLKGLLDRHSNFLYFTNATVQFND